MISAQRQRPFAGSCAKKKEEGRYCFPEQRSKLGLRSPELSPHQPELCSFQLPLFCPQLPASLLEFQTVPTSPSGWSTFSKVQKRQQQPLSCTSQPGTEDQLHQALLSGSFYSLQQPDPSGNLNVNQSVLSQT